MFFQPSPRGSDAAPQDQGRRAQDGLESKPCPRQSGAMRIALFEPEIAGNVGAVLRLGACLGAAVDLIEPMGFAWDDRRVRRTAMDYIDHVTIVHHASFEAFRATIGSRRLLLFTTKGEQSAYDFSYAADDVLLFGKESAGVPSAVADACDARLRIPMRAQVRSMNLASSAALVLGEALRQTGTLPAPGQSAIKLV
jgi:tRNA (cytidine/uridine-2'-O-)-methyltransferase